MDIAKSIYLGGKEINAEDPQLKTHSCEELGLTCTYCGEPVFHKNGYYNKAHFSHFPSIDPQKYEECLIRQRSVNGISFSDHLWWKNEGKAQRFDLFQKHFFYILKSEFPDIEIREISIAPQDVDLNEVQSQALTIIAQNKSGTDKYLRVCSERFADIEIDIIIESLDYITKASSRNIFKTISEYLAKKRLNIDGVQQDVFSDSEELYYKILDFIGNIPWLKLLAKITDVNFEELQKVISYNKKRVALREISAPLSAKKYLYCYKSTIFIADIARYTLSNEIQIAKIDMRRMQSSKWVYRRKRVPLFIAKSSMMLDIISHKDFSFDETIKSRLITESQRAISAYIEDEKELKVGFRVPEGRTMRLDRSIKKFVETRVAKIVLHKTSSSPQQVAEINIKGSSLRSQNYVFNNDCVRLENEYYAFLEEGICEIERGLVKVLETIHATLIKK